jgi:hypothetical protein
MMHAGPQNECAHVCGMCDETFCDREVLAAHRLTHRDDLRGEVVGAIDGFRVIQTAHTRTCLVMRYYFPDEIGFLHEAVQDVIPRLNTLLRFQRLEHKMYKVALTLNIEFVKINESGEIDLTIVVPFRASTIKVLPIGDVSVAINSALMQITSGVENFQQLGSGWSVNDILFFDAEIVKCIPLQGSCGLHHVVYRRERGLVFDGDGFEDRVDEKSGELTDLALTAHEMHGLLANPQKQTLPVRDDENCFYHAIAAHFAFDENCFEEREQFIQENINCCAPTPVEISTVKRFDEANHEQLEMALYVVYRDEQGDIYPVYLSKHPGAKNIIVLLLAYVGCGDLHYAYIVEPDKMLARRKHYSADQGYTRTVPAFFCYNCFSYTERQSSFVKHVAWCHKETGQHSIYPEDGETVEYEAKTGALCGYYLFFDFETLQIAPKNKCSCSPEVLRATEEKRRGISPEELEEAMWQDDRNRCLQQLDDEEEDERHIKAGWNLKRRQKHMEQVETKRAKRSMRRVKTCQHKTQTLSEQHAFAYSIVMIARGGRLVEDLVYVGNDAGEHFLSTLFRLEKKYLDPLAEGGLPMTPLSTEQKTLASNEMKCYICDNLLNDDRVHDHDHISGQFLGMAHNICNLHRRENIQIVAFAHNFSGYDSHIILKELGKFEKELGAGKHVRSIPLNTEKFKMLQLSRVTMLDSAAFLPDSLDNLVTNLRVGRESSGAAWPFLGERWLSVEDRNLLLRKGVYPYDYATSIEKLQTACALPSREDFYNRLGGEHISDEDYAHACQVWEHFQCRDMLDYTRLYVTSDSFLLAEVVLDLQSVIMNEFGLEIGHYLSLPMLAKDIMLKTTDVSMDLISDPEMARLLQSNIRGGLSYINTRLVDLDKMNKNRRALGHEPPPTTLPLSIAYLDANNLYGHAMRQPLPLRDYRWMSEDEVKTFDPCKDVTLEDGPGYILEV